MKWPKVANEKKVLKYFSKPCLRKPSPGFEIEAFLLPMEDSQRLPEVTRCGLFLSGGSGFDEVWFYYFPPNG